MIQEQDTAPFCRSTRRLRTVQIEERSKYASMIIKLGTDVELHITIVEESTK